MRRAAARSQCANNLKQIALGLTAQDPLGLPAGTVANPALAPERRLSWVVGVLPYVEEEGLYRRINLQASWDDEVNAQAVRTPVKVFQCPDWQRESTPTPDTLTPYVGPAGLGADASALPPGHPAAGVFGYDRGTTYKQIKDGTSNTLMILESACDNGPWARGGPATVRGLDTADRPYLGAGRPFGGTHFSENSLFGHGKPVGCNAALADGSVRFLRDTASPKFLEALITIVGGEEIDGEW